VRCRYLLRVTVTGKGMVADTKRDFPLWVRNYEAPPDDAPPIKMEVGIEDCLHIEFEYDRARYGLKDVVVGRIHFLLVRIRLKHMELEVRRRETTGAGSGAHSESETIAKYEIMDGAPVRGESIPIRCAGGVGCGGRGRAGRAWRVVVVLRGPFSTKSTHTLTKHTPFSKPKPNQPNLNPNQTSKALPVAVRPHADLLQRAQQV
jgi:hypothetical protein